LRAAHEGFTQQGLDRTTTTPARVSVESDLYLWDSETIPVSVIYKRAGYLYERFVDKEYRKRPSRRSVRQLESFVDEAEEDLVRERLTVEYYSAKRLPFASVPVLETPNWYFNPFNYDLELLKLENLKTGVNQLRTSRGDATLDNYVEYYWDLNRRGHRYFLVEFRNKEVAGYTPSLYREKCLAEDIAAVREWRRQERSPLATAPSSPQGSQRSNSSSH